MILLCLALLAALPLCLWAPRPSAFAGGSPWPCPVPVERRGQGVLCLSDGRAALLGVRAGDVVPVTDTGSPVAGPPFRMEPERLLLLGVPTDLNDATFEELVALPGVGPALARRIEAQRPLGNLEDLAKIPGIGRHGASRLASFVVLPPGAR